MPQLNESNVFLPGAQSFNKAIDTVSRHSKYDGDSPVLEAVKNKICSLHVLSF